MSDRPDNRMPVYLRRIDVSRGELRADMTDVKHRLTTLDIQVAQLVSVESSHYASTAIRLDRIEDRLIRLERRADMVPA